MPRSPKDEYIIEDAIERISSDFEKRGYELNREFSVGKRRVDLVATKGEEVILFEFKTPKEKDEAAIRELHEYARAKPHRQFRLVLVTPPIDRIIEVIGLEQALYDYLVENFPHELDSLSSHSRMEEVSDAEISAFIWDDNGARIKGTCVVGVSLQYGSDLESKGDPEISDTYPATFDVTLSSERKVEEVHKLSIDTSDFYE